MEKTDSKSEFLYKDLTYRINGALFNVFNKVGVGHRESFYQKASAYGFGELGLIFKEQLPAKITYKGKKIGIYYFDFLIEDKIILELKVRNYFSKEDINQLYSYLRAKNLRLGIIAHFTRTGVKIKRVVNIK
jgi:GxxExxY protein